MSHANVALHLTDMANKRPGAPALLVPSRGDYAEITYSELDRDSDRIARGLTALDVGRGVRTALFVTPGLDLFALVFALFKCGAVPVLLDPGMGLRALRECLDRVAPKAFIGVGKAHAARVLGRWASDSIRTSIWVGSPFAFGGHTLNAVRKIGESADCEVPVSVTADDVAAILFTSGSTGTPKGAVYTHGNFAAQVAMLREHFGIQPGEIDLPTFPLFALFDPALGMTTIVPDMDFTKPGRVDPRAIYGPVERFGVTNMFGSPALLRRVVDGDASPAHFATVKRVISAGAPVPADVLRRLRDLLPDDAEVFTPYGATEALPVCAIESREILGETEAKTREGAGVCVGRPTAPTEVRVIRIDDDAIETWSDDLLLPDGEIGEVCVRGPTVTESYAEQPDKTRRAKIRDGDTVWHRMGDVGRFDEQGRLWYCGRKAHRVVLADRTLFTMPVERALDGDGVRTALVGVCGPEGPEAVLLVEERQGGDGDLDLVRARLWRRPETAAVQQVLAHPGFPVDPRHNAKIRRELLAEWAQRRLYP